jgi:outer membrane protein insertion porin family
MHTEGGYITKNSSGLLPDYERFYLGGMNSMRGFDWRDITPMDPPGDPNGIKVGGNKKLLFNFELHRPLFKESGLVLLVFYDVGNAYDDHEKVDINNVRESWGYGVRWYSPIGPIRLEYGRIVNPREGEDSNGNWEFSMGNAF